MSLRNTYRLTVTDPAGNIVATKSVKTYLTGCVAAVAHDEAGELEYQWAMKAKELFRDTMFQEGRWPPKRN